MQSKPDAQLLREYADRGAEAAFAEIVHRHTNLVYSAALRQVDSPDAAAEIAQNVFVGLARGAQALSARLNGDASLAGWLCRSARNQALNFRRDEFRRHSRERLAMELLNPTSETAPDWERLRPVLDEAMAELTESDYDALVLRFFKNHDLRAVGQSLGVSDDTAQKRVSRALDKLREHLARRGVTTTATALSIVISANAVQTAPVGLAIAITTAAALTGTTLATTATATAAKTIAMTTLQKTLLTVALAAVAAVGIYEARQVFHGRDQTQAIQQPQVPEDDEVARLAEENARLSNQLAQTASRKDQASDQFIELLKLRSKAQLNAQEIAELKAALAGQDEKIPDSVATILKQMLTSAMADLKQSQRAATLTNVKQLAKRLGLSSEQHEQVRLLMRANDDTRVALEFNRAIGTLTNEDVERREKLRQDEARGLAAILTPDQQAAYETMKSAEAAASRKSFAAGEAKRLKGYLDLTDDQTKQVNSILMGLETGAGGLGINDYPNPREQMELRLQALAPALTPEQVQSYRKMKGDDIDRVLEEKAQYAKIVKALSQ